MNGLRLGSLLGAIAMSQHSDEHIASAVGVTEEQLAGEQYEGEQLSRKQAARLRRFLWRRCGVLMIDTPIFEAAIYVEGWRHLIYRLCGDRGDLGRLVRRWRDR